MGVALAAGARRHAADVAAWQAQHRQAVGAAEGGDIEMERLQKIYRAGGALLAAVGTALAVSARWAGLELRGISRGGAMIGPCVAALGAVFALSKWRAGQAAGEKAGDEIGTDAAVWALCALWVGFGLRLWSEGLR
jgi:hypothetical protein